MYRLITVFFLAVMLGGCTNSSKVEKEITEVAVELELVRFDQVFAAASSTDLPRLKQEFSMFFPEEFPDSIWQQRLTDTLQLQLNEAVQQVFPDNQFLEDGLHSLFQHIKYYHPEFQVPKVYTATSDVDYRTRVILADSLLILELDTFLGSDHPFYVGISKYIAKNMKPEMVVQDVATAVSRSFVTPPKQRTLLDQMVYFGKELYLKDLWLPNTPDWEKIGYTEAEWNWAQENESYIWANFIENELLYNTDNRLSARFINPAPFSKFNLEIDNESPGMIGRYIGWQIVRAYAEKNATGLNDLLALPAQQLFIDSKFKPKK